MKAIKVKRRVTLFTDSIFVKSKLFDWWRIDESSRARGGTGKHLTLKCGGRTDSSPTQNAVEALRMVQDSSLNSKNLGPGRGRQMVAY